MSASINRNSARHHPRSLSPIMLAILAASIGVAWWISQTRGAMSRRGADIIRKIRKETFRSYWKADPVTMAYLITNGEARDAGWEISIRKRTRYGYAGTTWTRGKDMLFEEKWQVRDDASRSDYQARALLAPDYPPVTIEFANDRVTIQIGGRRGGILASAKAPSNYIPEGVLAVVVRLAANMDHKLAFKMIFNETAIHNRHVQFTSVTMTPQPPASVVMRFGQHKKVYRLDAQGKIVRIEHPASGTVYEATGVRELIEKFPEVRRLIAEGT